MKGFVAHTRFQGALLWLATILLPFAVFSNKGIVILVALCAIAIVLTRPRLPNKSDRILILPGLLLLWSIASMIWAIDLKTAASVVRLVLALMMATVIYLEVGGLNNQQREQVLRGATLGILGALALLVLLALFPSQYLTTHDYLTNKIKPASTLISICIWPAAIYVWRRHSFWRAMLFVLVGAAILWLGTAKTAKLAFGIGLAVFVATLYWRKATSLILAAFVAASVMLMPVVASEPMKHTESVTSLVPPSGYHRLIIWDFVAERIAERPVLGWGYNSSRVIPGGDTIRPEGELLPLHPHNTPLQIWLELGAPGAILTALGLITMVVSAGRWERRSAASALAAFAAAWVVALLSYGVWQQWWLCGLIFALMLCRAASPAEDSKEPGTFEPLSTKPAGKS